MKKLAPRLLPFTALALLPVRFLLCSAQAAETTQIRYLGDEAALLGRMSADLTAPAEALVHRARQDFDHVPEAATINIHPMEFHPWQMPSYKGKNCDCDGTVESITRAGKKTLLDASGVPSPLPDESLRTLKAAAALGDQLAGRGMLGFDAANILTPSILGAYVYSKAGPIGILLNPMLKRMSQKAGDLLAWFTMIHEMAHAYMDIVLGRLSPEQKRLGEIYAFQAQADMWEHVDPRGEMISVLYHDFVENGKDPELAQVVKHHVELRYHANNGTLSQFVDGLGYEDEPSHAAGAAGAPAAPKP